MTNLQYNIIMGQSCRICLEEDDEIKFISPCNCSGSVKFVHRECLNKWRYSVDYNPLVNLDTSRLTTCEICNSIYNINETQNSYSKTSLFFLGLWDFFTITTILHILYFLFGFLAYKLGLNDFFLPSDNMYLNIYINGVCVVQTFVLFFYIIRSSTTGFCNNQPIFIFDTGGGGEECGLIASMFFCLLIMAFFFIYYDYITKQYYKRKIS
jgi:hypothetical protein